jgi:cytochrome b561
MSKLAEKLKHEFLELIPPTVYFFVVLHFAAAFRHS